MTAQQTTKPTLALSTLILLLTSISLFAQQANQFEQTINVTGAANTPDGILEFGMLPDAKDKLDDGEDIVPPDPPGDINTIAFAPEAVNSKLIRDIREPAETKTWTIKVNKNNDDANIVLTWTANEWADNDNPPTLTLTGAIFDQDYDLTKPSSEQSEGGVTISQNADLFITYGGAEPPEPEFGSLKVTSDPAGEKWRILNTDGSDVVIGEGADAQNLSTDDGNPIWNIALAGNAINDLPPGDYKVTFKTDNASLIPPDDQPVTITAGLVEEINVTYEKIPASIEFNPTRITVSEAGSTTDVEVSLGAEPVADVNINFSIAGTHPGAAVITGSSQLTFTADNYDTVQFVTIGGQDDDVVQPRGRSFLLDFTVTSGDDRYDGYEEGVADDSKVRGVTTDDDQPGLIVDRIAGARETTEAGETAKFSLVLAAEPSADVTVTVESTDSSEGIPNPTSVDFTATNWDQAQTVTVTGQDDDDVDGDMQYLIICDAESADANYQDRSRALRYVNVDDDEADRTTDLVFIPGKTLPFGIIPKGEDRSRSLTVYNAGDAEAQLNAEVFVPSRSEGFTVEGAASHEFTLPAGEGVQLEITATAKDAADGDQTRAALIFTDRENDDTVAAIALSSLTVPLPEAGTLAVDPELIVVGFSGETETGSFDIVLDTDIRFSRLLISLELPDFLSITGIDTNTDVTSGWSFGYNVSDDSILSAFYLDPFFDDDPQNSGITPGKNVVMTVSFEVDTSNVPEDSSDPIAFLEAKAADADTEYEISWGEDAATRAVGDSLGATDGLVAVTDKITLADLDVDGNGLYNTDDLVLIYRKQTFEEQGFTVEEYRNILVPSTITPGEGVSANDIIDNVDDLVDKLIDVDGDGAYDIDDLVLVYRKMTFEAQGFTVDEYRDILVPSTAEIGDGVVVDDVIENIEDIIANE